VLERHIGEHIRTVLRLGSASIDPKTPLRSLGFDSLLSSSCAPAPRPACRSASTTTSSGRPVTLTDLATGLGERLELEV